MSTIHNLIIFFTFNLITTFGYAANTENAIKIGILGTVNSIHPLQTSNEAETYVESLLFTPFIFIDQDMEWKCGICEEIVNPNLSENSKDKHTQIFKWKIKKDLIWSDGTPITGYDVLQSWQISRSINTTISDPLIYSQIERISVDSAEPKIFTVTFRSSNYENKYMRNVKLIPWHKEKNLWKSSKDIYNKYFEVSLYTTDPSADGIYNGPYKIKELKNDYIHLVKNIKHKKNVSKNPNEIFIYLYHNLKLLSEAFIKNQIDIIAEPNIRLSQQIEIENFLKSSILSDKYQQNSTASIVYDQITLNLRNPLLFQRKMREVIYNIINQDVLFNEYKNSIYRDSIFSPQLSVDEKNTTKSSSNGKMENSNKTLEGLGWKIGEDGYRYKENQKLSLSIMTNTSRIYAKDLLNQFTTQFKKVGIELKPEFIDDETFFNKVLDKANYTDMILFTWEQLPDFFPYSRFYSKEIPTAANGYDGQNIGNWTRKEVDTLLDKLKSEYDDLNRDILIKKIEDKVNEDIPLIYLFRQKQKVYYNQKIKTYLPSNTNFPSSLYNF